MTRANTIIDIDRFFRIGDSCWLWFGPLTGAGKNGKGFPYGVLKIKGKMHKAHRLMYEYFYGIAPGQLDVLHSCDTPNCVRPSHLFLGTHSDNMQDMVRKGRRNTNGERGAAAKITDQQALIIRQSKENNVLLTKRHGVQKASIWKIKNYYTYRHLP